VRKEVNRTVLRRVHKARDVVFVEEIERFDVK
jgi:hypothetical protein